MGVFVGLVSYQAVPFINANNWQGVLAAVLGASFGGVTVTFMNQKLGDAKESVFMYPVGLLLGFVWMQVQNLAPLILGNNRTSFWLGVLGIIGIIALTAFVAVTILIRLRSKYGTP